MNPSLFTLVTITTSNDRTVVRTSVRTAVPNKLANVCAYTNSQLNYQPEVEVSRMK